MKTSLIKMLILVVFASFISLGLPGETIAQQKDPQSKPRIEQRNTEKKGDRKPKKKHGKRKHNHHKRKHHHNRWKM
jgi:hypothetical protein